MFTRDQLFWMQFFIVFLSLSSQVPGYCVILAWKVSSHIIHYPYPITPLSYLIWYCIAMVTDSFIICVIERQPAFKSKTTWFCSKCRSVQLPFNFCVVTSIIETQYAGSSTNASDFSLGGTWFESQLGHQLSWLRVYVVFLGPSMQMPGTGSWLLFPHPFQLIIHWHPTIWCYI
jgi:hypothetical protein